MGIGKQVNGILKDQSDIFIMISIGKSLPDIIDKIVSSVEKHPDYKGGIL